MTPREKRKRQKRPRADVRKVHRFGFRPKGGRQQQTAACGETVNRLDGKGSRAVVDAAFVYLPQAVQCKTCRAAAHACVPSLLTHGHLHGTHEHLMAVELLVAMLQRLWQARLEVGHRCYMSGVHVILSDNGYAYAVPEAAFYPLGTCACGSASWTDPRRWQWEIATAMRPGEKYKYSNVCCECGHCFFTDRPRGSSPTCNMCRGKLVCDERLSDFEFDTFSEAYLDAVDAIAEAP